MAFDSPRAACVQDCFDSAKDLSDVGRKLAALFNGKGPVGLDGSMAIYPDTKAIDSGFAPYAGSGAHLNGMPVNKRLVGVEGPEAGDNGEEGAGVFLNHVPAGNLPHANMHGDGGFALNILNGVFRSAGESWMVKWAVVKAHVDVGDEKTYSLPSSASSTYYAANCFTCSDSKGRGETRVPVRLYWQYETARAAIGTVVGYVRDLDGVARVVTDTLPAEASSFAQYAVATTDWDWVTGRDLPGTSTSQVGFALFQDANDVFGATNGASETTYTVYLPATAGADPNIHAGDLVTYESDASGNKIADSGYLDCKINSVEMWNGTPSNIKAGWIEHSVMRSRFAVGYDPDETDYNAVENTGGSHPITPVEHSSDSSPSTWLIDDHVFTSSLNTASLTVTAHPQTTSSSNATGLTVSDHAAKDTSSSATGVNNHSAGTSGSGNANLANHSVHANSPETTTLSIVESTASGVTNVTVVTSVSAGGETLSHSPSGHTHSTPELSHSGDEHTHRVSLYSHSVTDGGHSHTSSPLDHVVVDGGHAHTSTLPHTGTLPHVEEDYRPPYSTVLWVVRVHPDQE